MTPQRAWKYRVLVSTYGVLALGIMLVFSPMAFSFIPLAFAAVFLYLASSHSHSWFRLSFDIYLFLALPLMWESALPAYLAWLTSVPLVWAFGYDLGQVARSGKSIAFRKGWGVSEGLVRTGVVILIAIILATLLGKLSVIIAGAVLAGWLAVMVTRVVRAMPEIPVTAMTSTHRVLADDNLDFTLSIESSFKYGGWLSIQSPYKWVNVEPVSLPLSNSKTELQISLTPYLSGPSSVRMDGSMTDCWGLLSRQIEFEVADLQVIPRARYAMWLAQKYLETSQSSAVMSMTSAVKKSKQAIGSRRGMDFYGTRLHQPGDSLRSIDWKHSMKLQDFVVREYEDSQTSSAMLLVNLAASSEQAADRLVYSLLTTAITLAAEGIPSVVAAYDHQEVAIVTESLDHRRLVLKCLELSHKVVHWERSHRYLATADLQRIRANKKRLEMLRKDSLATLIELMEVELKAIGQTAATNPATEALKRGLHRTRESSSVLILSERNHDEEALQQAKYDLRSRNLAFTEISLNSKQNRKGRTRKVTETAQVSNVARRELELAHA